MDPNKLVRRMGHGWKKMVHEVYGNHVEGIQKDAGGILEYCGNDFINLLKEKASAFTTGESNGESRRLMKAKTGGGGGS